MIRAGARAGAVEPLDAVVLGEIRAALSAGAAPAAALAAVRSGPLEAAARAARLGRPLSEIAAATGTGDVTADLLVRALALAEHAGSGACEAVDQALAAMRSEWALARLLAVRTVQARATAVILTAVPALAWALLVATDRSTVAFYATPLGLATGLAATILAAGGFGWSRRIVSAAQRAAGRADPLSAPQPRPDVGRILVVALPAFALASLALGFGAGLLALVAGGAVGLKRGSPPADEQSSDGRSRQAARDARTRARAGVGAGGAAEAIELVATALTAGLGPTAALAATAPLAPEAA
ncbi:MAG TPA: hypothetical protein VML96_09100, partial [Egibacteraceae bacterium]|nr:hypothetical protein [Egibacteraceae bacterium]